MSDLDKDTDMKKGGKPETEENTSSAADDDLEFIDDEEPAREKRPAERSRAAEAFDEMERADRVARNAKRHKRRRVWPLVLIIIVVVVVAGYFGYRYYESHHKNGNGADTQQTSEQNTEQTTTTTDQNISALITNYLSAYAVADFDSLPDYASPLTDLEEGYISANKSHIESYNDIVCTKTKGPKNNTWFVMVTDSVKYYNVDTERPQILFFYVYRDSNGLYKIDNRYSMFNRKYLVSKVDKDIYKAFKDYLNTNTVKDAQADVSERSQKALDSDDDLDKAFSSLSKALSKWESSAASDITKQQKKSGNDLTDAKKVKVKKEAKKVTSKKISGTGRAKTLVNVRKKPSEDAKRIGRLKKKKKVTLLARTSNHWYKIRYKTKKGKKHTGYVMAKYIKKIK